MNCCACVGREQWWIEQVRPQAGVITLEHVHPVYVLVSLQQIGRALTPDHEHGCDGGAVTDLLRPEHTRHLAGSPYCSLQISVPLRRQASPIRLMESVFRLDR